MVIEARYNLKAALIGLFPAFLAIVGIFAALDLLDPNWHAYSWRLKEFEQMPPLLRSSIFLTVFLIFAPLALPLLYGGLTRGVAFRINNSGVIFTPRAWLFPASSMKWNEIEVVKLQNKLIVLETRMSMRKSRPWLTRAGIGLSLVFTNAKQDEVLTAIYHYRPDLMASGPTPA